MGTRIQACRLVGLSLLVSLAVWILWTWPLARHVSSGIPIAHSGGREAPVRFMEPGDHLQLLYYYWLLGDMLEGRTAWMFNPYEFHTGSEEARYEPGAYYIPFSLVYALAARWGGRAFGFNLAGLVSIWIAYLFTWLFVRRYVRNEWIAGVLSVTTLLIPYRWFALLGGSPTGFAMALPPVLLWGLDRAVRDDSRAGGAWAGAALFFSFTSDLHVFFFNALLIPAWGAVAFCMREEFAWRRPRAWLRLAGALAPLFLAAVAAGLLSRGVARDLTATHMAGGRTLEEVRHFAPMRSELLGWPRRHGSGQIFIGFALPLLLLGGSLAAFLRFLFRRPRSVRRLLLFAALWMGFALIVLLALGPHGPDGGRFFALARRLVPRYDMIRQTGKIFAVLPALAALLAALSAEAIRSWLPGRRRYAAAVVLVPLLLMGGETKRRVHPPICLLTDSQPAYEAVARDAEARGGRPHILVVTLWPGDSHYASLYQYYCSLYRIRMVNGYTPAVGQAYFEDLFLRFQSINQGWLTDAQADELLERGIGHIIVHEDLFPEKVSPFPVAFTLQALLEHERLSLLKQDGPIWAFRILEQPASEERTHPPGPGPWFPARHWIFENQPREQGEVRRDPTASRGHYLAMVEPGASTVVGPAATPPAPDLRWMIRVRGNAVLALEARVDGTAVLLQSLRIEAPDWTWLEVPFSQASYAEVSLHLRLDRGWVDACSALLTAGPDPRPAPGETVTLPAALFFHAGHLDPATGQVRFSSARDRTGPVFYGPKLPFHPGEYEVEFHFSAGDSGRKLGEVHVEQLFTNLDAPSWAVQEGYPARGSVTLPGNLPANWIFEYSGAGDLSVEAVSFKRVR